VFFKPGDRIFLDESKNRKYVVAATFLPPRGIFDSEKFLRSLLLPGQRRLHFTREGERRRKILLTAMGKLDIQVAIWQVSGRPEGLARTMCITSIAQSALELNAESLVLETDESIEASDRRLLFELSSAADKGRQLAFQHSAPHHQPLLWVSDAIAWCYAKGGMWAERASPLVEDRVVVLP
jgi:hypothetical protein